MARLAVGEAYDTLLEFEYVAVANEQEARDDIASFEAAAGVAPVAISGPLKQAMRDLEVSQPSGRVFEMIGFAERRRALSVNQATLWGVGALGAAFGAILTAVLK